MAAPRRYPDELRERATRMAVEVRRDPATRAGALARMAGQLGINPETLRNLPGVGVPLGHRGSDGFASPVTGPPKETRRDLLLGTAGRGRRRPSQR
jgi:hypothetical protein